MTEFDYLNVPSEKDGFYDLLMRRKKEQEASFSSSIIVDEQYLNLFFVRSFLTDPMLDDLPAIMQEFVPSHFDKLRVYDDADDILDLCDGVFDAPIAMFAMRLVCLILNAAKDGDASSVELLRYLFKSYHKSKYNNLKRFRKLTAKDLLALSRENAAADDEGFYIAGHELCIYIIMAPFMGIEILKDAEFGKLCITFKKIYEDRISEFCCADAVDQLDDEFIDGGSECVDMLIARDFVGFHDSVVTIDDFVKYSFADLGANPDLVKEFKFVDGPDFMDHCADTAAILQYCFPCMADDFSLREIVLFAALYDLSRGLVIRCQKERDFLLRLLGLDRGYQPKVFRSEKITKPTAPTYKKVAETVAPVIMNEGVSKEEEIAVYRAEILELRRRLREKESDVSHYKSECDELKRKNTEMSRQIARYEGEHEELVALRTHVYEQSEEQVTESGEVSFEEKKAAVSEKTVVIIGGNENWTKKLRNDFPKWRFVAPNPSGTIPDNVCDNADMVYFFTDTLGHSNYGRFVKIVREKQIPFGYMHGVNLQVNVSQVYRDLCSI